MPDDPRWTRCPRCNTRLKHLKRHMRKKHKGAPARVRTKEKRLPRATRGAFVTCEYCPATMHAAKYKGHVHRRHPGKRVNRRPALGEQVSKQGLSKHVSELLRRLKVPGYKQKYKEWYREVQGGAPGSGRRGR